MFGALLLAAALLAGLVLGLTARAGPLPGDRELSLALHAMMGTPAGAFLAWVSIATNAFPWDVLHALAGIRLWAHDRAAGIAMLGGLTLEGLVPLLKLAFGRERPDYPDLAGLLHDASFPSGHVARVAVTAALAVILVAWPRPALRAPALALAALAVLLISVSRVALGVHWPSDVLGGALAGMIWAAALVALVRRRHPATLEPSAGSR